MLTEFIPAFGMVTFAAAFGMVVYAVLSGTYNLYRTLRLVTPDKYTRRRMRFKVIEGGRDGYNFDTLW